MGTRSTIALEFADGTVGSIYCHWDGYLSYNGRILLESYMDPNKVRELIDLGDMSSLAPEVGTKHEFSNPHSPGTDEYQAYEKLTDTMCTFYGRDRGEENTNAKYYKDYEAYTQELDYQEFNYILRNIDGQAVWFVDHWDSEGFKPLKELYEAEKATQE